jgi:hypothetical protein
VDARVKPAHDGDSDSTSSGNARDSCTCGFRSADFAVERVPLNLKHATSLFRPRPEARAPHPEDGTRALRKKLSCKENRLNP